MASASWNELEDICLLEELLIFRKVGGGDGVAGRDSGESLIKLLPAGGTLSRVGAEQVCPQGTSGFWPNKVIPEFPCG